MDNQNEQPSVQKTPDGDPKAKDRKIVIKVLKILGFTAAAIIVVYLILTIAENVRKSQKNNEPETEESLNYFFYDADFDEDITEDQIYMGLDRNIYYHDPDMGTTESLNQDSLSKADPEIVFLYEVIGYIIKGDRDSYEGSLAPSYLLTYEDGKVPPFTAQKLYNIEISKYTKNDDGSVTYKVDYMIRRNNGTFRSDVDSDAIRSRFVTISDHGAGFLIDQIVNYRTAS